MKVPCRWLADYVEIDLSKEGIARLAERLTLAGLEVEETEWTGSLSKTVVGRVREVRSHPNADKLVLCCVDLGGETVEIVCGAPNVVEGALVPVALDGAVLPNGMQIETRKVRGETSHGMICSKEELQLEDHSEGIWNLDPSLGLSVGDDLTDHLEYDDAVFDFKVASNRPDCASVYGVAREVAAILNRPLSPLDTSIDESPEAASERVKVVIEDPKDTPRYAARLFEEISIGPAPLRIQHRLVKAGMRPLSNVVDATNYVMLELGQPLHPFDADDIGKTITIRRAAEGEVFRTLDDVDRALTPATLMITDENGSIALAGVMGGEQGEIQDKTTRVLLEVASFDSYVIRQSSRAVGLRTEASQRFERGLDPEGVRLAADRTAHWIQTLTGCRILDGLAEAFPAPSVRRTLRLRPERARALLGIEVSAEESLAILRRLEVDAEVDGAEIVAVIPSHRPDLEREVDLVEEIGRVYGYDRLEAAAPHVTLRVGRKDRIERGKDRIRESLVASGLFEVLTDGFDKPAWREALGLSSEELVTVRNPMAATQNAMRLSLLPGVLGVVEANLSVGVDGGMVFELGRVFSKARGERESLAGALFGRTERPLRGKETVELPTGLGVLDNLFATLQLAAVARDQDNVPSYLHPGRSVRFARNGETFGRLGELAPALVDRLAVPTTVYVFEFDTEPLLAHAEDSIVFAALPKFPASKRDLSLSSPIGLPEGRIREVLRTEGKIESVLLYDLYRGEQVSEGRKSLTYEVTLRAPDRTLTDEEVSKILGKIETRLRDLDVHLRTE